MVSTELDPEGRILQFNEMQTLTYGERDGQLTPRIQHLDEAFRGAGFETELSTNIMQAMWQKWVGIATLGLVNCLFNGSSATSTPYPRRRDRPASPRRVRRRRHSLRLPSRKTLPRKRPCATHHQGLKAHLVDVSRHAEGRKTRSRRNPRRPARTRPIAQPQNTSPPGRLRPPPRLPEHPLILLKNHSLPPRPRRPVMASQTRATAARLLN